MVVIASSAEGKNRSMRALVLVMVMAWAGSLLGCVDVDNDRAGSPICDTQMVSAVNDEAIRNAIISQHTLYPYHFVPNSGQLNGLGQRDLAVLAEQFKDNPGSLNVRRGEAPDDLYQARLNVVIAQLQTANVDTGRIRLADALPGGDGMVSDRVLLVLAGKIRALPPGVGYGDGFVAPTAAVLSQPPVTAVKIEGGNMPKLGEQP